MRIDEYLDAVCSQIRWKAARTQVREEIRSHMEQRAEEYAAAGDNRELAEDKAVAQMGNAEKTGRELDRLHRPKYDWAMIGAVGALLVLCIIQAVTAQGSDGYQYPLGWVGGLVTAIAGCVLFSLVNFRKLLEKIRHPAAINLACTACIAVFALLVLLGVDVYAYLPFLVLSFLFRFLFYGLIFSLVAWISRIKTKRQWLWFILAAIVSTVVLFFHDSDELEYALCAWLLVWMNRTAKKHSILPAVAGAMGIIALWFWASESILFHSSMPLRMADWAPLFKTPGLNWFGHGFGESSPLIPNLYSNSITDFFWQYGIAAGIALLGLCGVALWRADRMRRGIRDSAGRMLALCFCTVLFTQAIAIAVWGIGLIPNQGSDALPMITLNFPLSLYQGCLIGILISLYRTKDNFAREQTPQAIAG